MKEESLIEVVAKAIYLHMFPERDSAFWYEREADGDLRQNYMGAAKAVIDAIGDRITTQKGTLSSMSEEAVKRHWRAHAHEFVDSEEAELGAYKLSNRAALREIDRLNNENAILEYCKGRTAILLPALVSAVKYMRDNGVNLPRDYPDILTALGSDGMS